MKKDKGSPIMRAEDNFAKIPVTLLKEKSKNGNIISDGGIRLYALLHSYSRTKSYKPGTPEIPNSFPSQKRLADDMNKTEEYVRQKQRELEKKGWLTTIRVGLGRCDIKILHVYKNQNIDDIKKRFIGKNVRKMREEWRLEEMKRQEKVGFAKTSAYKT